MWTFVGKIMSLLFNTLSRFIIALLPRSKSLNFIAAVTVCSDLGAICHEVMGPECHNLFFFWMLSFKPVFSLSSFTFIKRLFSSSFSAIRVVSSAPTGVGSLSLLQWIFPTQEYNWGLLHCRQILYQLNYERSPEVLECLDKRKLTCDGKTKRKQIYELINQLCFWYTLNLLLVKH